MCKSCVNSNQFGSGYNQYPLPSESSTALPERRSTTRVETVQSQFGGTIYVPKTTKGRDADYK